MTLKILATAAFFAFGGAAFAMDCCKDCACCKDEAPAQTQQPQAPQTPPAHQHAH